MAHTKRGLWSEPGVPHKGWRCVDMQDAYDYQDYLDVCEMCTTADIRYIHYMEHDDYPDPLRVGCICAENMEEDYVAPREREKRFISERKRKNTWIDKRWKVSRKGNDWKQEGMWLFTIFQSYTGNSYKLFIKNDITGDGVVTPTAYPTPYDAKLAAWDFLQKRT
jgi:hypothetical protein